MRYAVTLAPITGRAIFELRGDPAAAQRCLGAIGLIGPTRPNSLTGHPGDAEVLWVGPRRWLVFAPMEREAALGATIERAAANEPLLLAAPLSDMFWGMNVTGAECRDILAQGTPLDLSVSTFPADMATFTEFFAVPALLRRARGTTDGFELWADRSFARYLEDWLAAANGAED